MAAKKTGRRKKFYRGGREKPLEERMKNPNTYTSPSLINLDIGFEEEVDNDGG